MKNSAKTDDRLELIFKKLEKFSRDRDWEKYHTPKNLSMALAVEASELMEIFQWLTGEESLKDNLSQKQKEKIEEEISDVLIYAIRMAQVLDIDLLNVINKKIDKNDLKYPAEKIKGKHSLD